MYAFKHGRAGARASVLLVIVIFGVTLGMYQLVPPSAVSAGAPATRFFPGRQRGTCGTSKTFTFSQAE